MVSHSMGDQNILFRAPPCFGRHVKPLVPVAIAVVSPTPVSRRVDVRQAAGSKNNFRIFITTWWKACTDPTLWDKCRKKKRLLIISTHCRTMKSSTTKELVSYSALKAWCCKVWHEQLQGTTLVWQRTAKEKALATLYLSLSDVSSFLTLVILILILKFKSILTSSTYLITSLVRYSVRALSKLDL
jgi:hypothetical protein